MTKKSQIITATSGSRSLPAWGKDLIISARLDSAAFSGARPRKNKESINVRFVDTINFITNAVAPHSSARTAEMFSKITSKTSKMNTSTFSTVEISVVSKHVNKVQNPAHQDQESEIPLLRSFKPRLVVASSTTILNIKSITPTRRISSCTNS